VLAQSGRSRNGPVMEVLSWEAGATAAEMSCVRLVGSIAAKLRAALGDEGSNSFLGVVVGAGNDNRFFFGIELIR
jgi:hypothetical protein